MLLAPVAVIPLGLLVALVLWAGRSLNLAAFPVAVLGIGALALGSRAFHLDGLSDTADGLTASYDRERSLAVMKSGSAGPAGVVAIVVVLGVQVGSLAALVAVPGGPLLAAFLICASRASLALACLAGVPAARTSGLAVSYAGTIPRWLASLIWLVAVGLSTYAFRLAGFDLWRGPVAMLAGAFVVALLLIRCVRRFGGVTGDVFGAGIELCLAVMLLAST
ncbi:MAG: adenosylcobinamide-GDP ribazoletransferase [Marmoricola sp.]|jgi:adenosylcobinamide-GDP ribazoletransferase|nr:adenosylcobinamide-GDP ribazoletransferase [Marmoricola sp.]